MAKPGTDLVDRLIHAGTAPDEESAGLVAEAGLEEVSRALVAELVFRCENPDNTTPINVALDVTHAGERRRTVLRLRRDEPIRIVTDTSPVFHMRLEMSATDLTRRLFGRSGHRRTGDFGTTFLPMPATHLYDLAPASRATNTIMNGCSPEPPGLGDLAVRYGSDKWASFHWYTPHYERHFARFRDDPVRVLEIGVGGYDGDLGGASLRMWKRYFHRGTVFGVDLFDKSALDEARLTTLRADQSVPEDMVAIGEEHGPFDIVIDDGSHIGEHVHTSFAALFPYLRGGGLYVIEDLHASYLPEFGGTPGREAGPGTSIGLLKRLLDDLHHQEWEGAVARTPGPTEGTVTGLHVHHNIAFIEKGVNAEEGFPEWMRELIAEARET